MTLTRRMRSLLLLVLSVVLATPLVLGAMTTTASASVPSMESQLLSLTNADRAHAGLAPLGTSSTLTSIARAWSAHMASTKSLVHDPTLASQVSGWSSLGENIAMAYSSSQANTLFMGSAGHRANILKAAYNRVGIGVSRASDGSYWFVVDFEQTSGYHAPATHTAPTHAATHTTSHRSTTTTTRSTRASRASRSAVRPALVRAPTAVPAVAPLLPTVRIDDRLVAIEARLSETSAIAVAIPRPGFTGPDPTRTALVISGGLLVTALAGLATARPSRIRVRGIPGGR
jgi:Cysteine-rich secretory protein family